MKIIEDDTIDMILISSIPKDRAELAILAMQNGKDVMVDKPGCTTLEQLEQIKSVVKNHRRIWSVNFSERFQVPAVAKAEDLVNSGVIGKVVQTIGTGPHRKGNYARPDWFYDRESYGGILTDIGSHQVHQFLIFTGSTTAKINHALVQNSSIPEKRFPRFWRNKFDWKLWSWIYKIRLVYSRCFTNLGRWQIIYTR